MNLLFGYNHLILSANDIQILMQEIDERMRKAGQLIEDGEIETFEAIFKHVPKTIIARALHGSTSKWYENKFADPYWFRVGELVALAKAMHIDAAKLLALMEPAINAITDRQHTHKAKPKPKLEEVEKDRQRAKDLKARGMKMKEIYELMGISRGTLYRYLNSD